MDWHMDRFADDEYYRRCSVIKDRGLPATLRFSQGNFMCVYLEPLPGWTALANDASIAEMRAGGWDYHISVSSRWAMSRRDMKVWEELRAEWDGREVLLEISHITSGATAVLSSSGLGGDRRIWTLFLKGPMGYKYRRNGHGLHVSM
jgi:hypothetical protein